MELLQCWPPRLVRINSGFRVLSNYPPLPHRESKTISVLGRLKHSSGEILYTAHAPDERRGSVVKAFVVLAAGNEPSDELAGEIGTFVRDRHSAYAYPRKVEFVTELPKTLTGKIRRIELRQREQQT